MSTKGKYFRGPEVAVAIRAAVIEAFVKGEIPTQCTLAATAGVRSHATVGTRLQLWAQQGKVETQRARNGAGVSPFSFNFTGRPIGDVTLATALEAFFAAPASDVPGYLRRAVRTAVRHALGLGRKCSDRVLLAAAATVDATRLHSFPEQVYEAVVADPGLRHDAETASQRRADVRRFLRWSAERDLIPMVFPRLRDVDAWEGALEEYLPTKLQAESTGEEHPIPLGARNHFRVYWRQLKDALVAVYGETDPLLERPLEIPLEYTEAACTYYFERGEESSAVGIRRMLSSLARLMKVGPYLSRPNRATIYLKGAPGVPVTTYNGFLDCLDHNGLHPSMREFFEWYGEYSTASRRELQRARTREGAPRFPPRRVIHKLKGRTMLRRTVVARMFAGVAIHRCGLDPATLTPEVLFGTHAEVVAAELENYWIERAKAGVIKDEASAGLWQTLIGAAQIAQVLYRKMRFEAGARVFTEQVEGSASERSARSGKAWRQAMRTEEAAAKTPEQEAVWDAYVTLNTMGSQIEEEVKENNAGNSANTQVNIREVWRATPASWYLGLLDYLLKELRRLRHAGRRNTPRYHELCWTAYVLAWQITTGMRRGEMSHIRLDIQYAPHHRQARIVLLRKKDRKNSRGHECRIWESILPDWLEAEYLKHTRPYLMGGDAERHNWLFVNADGESFGCTEEDEKGDGRDDVAHNARLSRFATLWRRRVVRAARRARLKIPANRRYVSPHRVRGVIGFLVYKVWGLDRAADYLGDRPNSIVSVYMEMAGEHVQLGRAVELAMFGQEHQRVAQTTPDEDIVLLPVAPATPVPAAEVSAVAATRPPQLSTMETIEAAHQEFMRRAQLVGLKGKRLEQAWEKELARLLPDE